MLTFDVITLFPEMFVGPLSESIIKIAQEKKKVHIDLHQLRDFTHDRHKTCDDAPFGGGPGMVMKPEPIFEAIEKIKSTRPGAKVVFLTPKGKPFDQNKANAFAEEESLILLCGHYEGIDQRVIDQLVDEEISIGDFVLTGGELPAMCLIDAITRLIPGVVGNEDSLNDESFQGKTLDYPHYTRPQKFREWEVPQVLLSGNHQEVAKWRKEQSELITKKRRPDLWDAPSRGSK